MVERGEIKLCFVGRRWEIRESEGSAVTLKVRRRNLEPRLGLGTFPSIPWLCGDSLRQEVWRR